MKKWLANVIRILFFAAFVLLISQGKMMLWFAVFAVSLILAVVFGRIYCGYVCPMNTVMLVSEWLSKKLKLSKDAPKWMEKGFLPWLFAGLSVAVMIVSQKVLHINIPLMIIWVVVSLVVTLVYKPYVFHNLVCPFGALQKVFGRFAIFSKKVDAEKCIGCGKCEKVCPSAAIVVGEDNKAFITKSICHQCEYCVLTCPTDAIKYKK